MESLVNPQIHLVLSILNAKYVMIILLLYIRPDIGVILFVPVVCTDHVLLYLLLVCFDVKKILFLSLKGPVLVDTSSLLKNLKHIVNMLSGAGFKAIEVEPFFLIHHIYREIK